MVCFFFLSSYSSSCPKGHRKIVAALQTINSNLGNQKSVVLLEIHENNARSFNTCGATWQDRYSKDRYSLTGVSFSQGSDFTNFPQDQSLDSRRRNQEQLILTSKACSYFYRYIFQHSEWPCMTGPSLITLTQWHWPSFGILPQVEGLQNIVIHIHLPVF